MSLVALRVRNNYSFSISSLESPVISDMNATSQFAFFIREAVVKKPSVSP